MVTTYTRDLRLGASFLKHVASGKPHKRHVDCSNDLNFIRWGKEKGKTEKSGTCGCEARRD